MIIRKVRDIVFAIVFLVIAVGVGLFFYYKSFYTKAINAPFSSDDSAVEVVIAPGDSVEQITEKLIAAGVLSDKKMPDGRYVFQWYLSLNNKAGGIQAGRFHLQKNLNMIQLTDILYVPSTEDLWITIIEGKRIEEIADAIDEVLNSESNKEHSNFDRQTFIQFAKGSRYSEYEFTGNIPQDRPLEGFLFPDSYLVEKDVKTEAVLKLLLTTFDQKVYQPYKAEITNNKYSLYELVTIASMVERESRIGDERAMIADIMFRRLETSGWRLEIDATLQYGLGWSEEEQSWWRQNLPSRYTENLYNTSIGDGDLPPTPICSPSESAFEATLRPVSNDYWFYLHDSTGQVHFSETLQEHESKRQEYL